jgi:hypothetical protein
MKAIYFFIRGVCLVFIGLWKLIAYIFYHFYYNMEQKMMRSAFWEDRVMCMTGIVLFMGGMIVWLPLWLSFLCHNFDWMCLSLATATVVMIPGICGLYYGYEHTKYDGRIDMQDLTWGYKEYMPATKVKQLAAEDDPDFKAGMAEVDEHLDTDSNWEKRLKNAPAIRRKKR